MHTNSSLSKNSDSHINQNTPGRRLVIRSLTCAFILALVICGHALTVQQLDLKGLCKRAERILRVTVLDISSGTVEVGGGKLPTTTYRLQVKEALGGAETGVIDVKVVGNVKADEPKGKFRRLDPPDGIPRLQQGGDYLVFTTRASRIGLVSFVGLEQGCFRVYTQDKKEWAVNGADNSGLGLPKSGPALYSDLAQQIRQLRNQ